MYESCPAEALAFGQGFVSGDFLGSVAKFLTQDKVAAYGWFGEIAPHLPKHPWLKIEIPEPVIIGYDAVCLVRKKGATKESIRKAKEFALALTDRAATRISVRDFQYFSPFENDFEGLTKESRDVNLSLLKAMAKKPPVYLEPPSPQEHAALNKWWRKLRFEKPNEL